MDSVILPKLVGIYSPVMQSGKSTVAEFLIKEHGYTRVPFADALKRMVFALLCSIGMSKGEAESRVWGARKEEPIEQLGGVTTRFLMQTLGTDWGRDIVHANVWVWGAMAAAEELWSRGHRVVIDDMRFRNEARAVREAGGRTVCVYRPDAPEPGERHVSEGQLDDWLFDVTLCNATTIEDLHHKVNVWLSMYAHI